MSQKFSAPPSRVLAERLVRDIRRAMRKHHSAEDKIRSVMEGLDYREAIENTRNWGSESFAFPAPLSYSTSPSANMLSALGGLGNSRVFAGSSPETLMVQRRNGRAFSLRIEGFSPKLEGRPIFPARFNALI